MSCAWFVRSCLALALLATSVACGPKDVIPSSPHHPASPEAPTGKAPPPGDDKQAIAAAEQAAYEQAKPVFDKYCGKCHLSGGAKANEEKLGHFSMDSYPFGGQHATEIGERVRVVLGVTGKPPTMPADAPGSVQGAELEALVEWSHAFDRSHAAGLHDHGDHGDHGHHGHH